MESISRARKSFGNPVRLMDCRQLSDYVGLGRCKAVEYAKTIGAEKKFGSRSTFDKYLIDEDLNNPNGVWSRF